VKGLVGAMAALCAALIVACAAPSRQAAPSVAGTAPTGPVSPRDEIARLDGEIAAQRGQLGLSEPAVQPMASTVQPMSVPSAANDPSCHPAKSETCTNSCTMSDSICVNAAKICDLANQLAGDSWAAGKCASATETCKAAHDKCCGCQLY